MYFLTISSECIQCSTLYTTTYPIRLLKSIMTEIYWTMNQYKIPFQFSLQIFITNNNYLIKLNKK